MGFNKRYISLESILAVYKRDSIEGLHVYFSADALIGGQNCSDILDLYFSGQYEELAKLLDLEISKTGSSD